MNNINKENILTLLFGGGMYIGAALFNLILGMVGELPIEGTIFMAIALTSIGSFHIYYGVRELYGK